MNNKFKNARVVTFSEEYKVKGNNGQKNVSMHKKGAVIVCHKSTVSILKDAGAKITVKEYDYEGQVAKAQKAAKKSEQKD